MYEEFFKFSSPPFRLNPDPKFFFGSRSHNKAMAYLHYGLRQNEGFIVITGEIGAGKSMLISHLMDQLDRSNVVAAHLLTANLKPDALLAHILSAFRIEPSGSGESAAIEAFEDFLFDQMNRGRRVLLVVDEAQNLPIKTIEELRMLSNMDYDGTPLFQVFLVGQPEFRTLLTKPEMEQFRQRVIASYHLEPLSLEETSEYIRHRLSLVGWKDDPNIDEAAFRGIFEATGGVPRKINKLCNRILLFCSLEKRRAVDAKVVETVLADLRSETVGGVEMPAEQAKPAEEATEPSVRKQEKQRAAAASGGAAPKRAGGGARKAKAPVVVPFEQPRRHGAEEDKASPRKASETKDHGEREGAMKRGAPPQETDDTDFEHMSVLDRLRAQREANAAAAEKTAATLNDVAKAIAEAAAGVPADSDDDVDDTSLTPINAPAFAADPQGWRGALVKSINDTREDLKSAHQGVTRVERRLAELSERRAARRRQIADNLARAETLLTEIRKTWG